MILLSIIMGILMTAVVFGIGYLFYEIIMDMLKPAPKKIDDMPVKNIRFKKPNL